MGSHEWLCVCVCVSETERERERESTECWRRASRVGSHSLLSVPNPGLNAIKRSGSRYDLRSLKKDKKVAGKSGGKKKGFWVCYSFWVEYDE